MSFCHCISLYFRNEFNTNVDRIHVILVGLISGTGGTFLFLCISYNNPVLLKEKDVVTTGSNEILNDTNYMMRFDTLFYMLVK